MSTIILTEDGSPTLQSAQFGVTYHSIHGALQETETVFINAALRYKAETQQDLSILGIGFGTGLNAFMTYLAAKQEGLKIDYLGVEAYPIDMKTVAQLNYATLLDAATEQEAFLQLHASHNTKVALSPDFSFCKQVCTFQELDFTEQFDIVYYDAFAPNAQPELWETELLSKMYQALKPTGVLTTYCAKGAFKRALKSVGFTVEGLPGPIGKREMTRALK